MAHNLIDQKFGQGEVLKKVPKPSHLKRGGSYWLVQCKCGNTSVVDTTSLRTKWQSCGCLQEKNLIDKRFAKGVVKKLIGSDGKKSWLLQCDCGEKYKALTESLLSGNTKSCGCLNKRTGKNHPHYKGCEDLSGDYWSKLKQGARKRDIEFNITIKEAWKLFKNQDKKCALTGWEITLTDSSSLKQTASLDRINSNKHYKLSNIQWVHKDVNRIKQNYSQDYFITICEAIASRRLSSD